MFRPYGPCLVPRQNGNFQCRFDSRARPISYHSMLASIEPSMEFLAFILAHKLEMEDKAFCYSLKRAQEEVSAPKVPFVCEAYSPEVNVNAMGPVAEINLHAVGKEMWAFRYLPLPTSWHSTRRLAQEPNQLAKHLHWSCWKSWATKICTIKCDT